MKLRTIFHIVSALTLTAHLLPARAQEVVVPDSGLNAAIRDALHKPIGPLTQQDLLSLTDLNASGRNITNVAGLEAARNLIALDLFNNHLTSFSLPSGLTNLSFLDVSANPLTNCTLPVGLTHLETLIVESTSLSNLSLPAGLIKLTELDLGENQLTRFTVPVDATNLLALSIAFNQLTNLTLPANLRRFWSLDVDFNHLQSLTLPPGLTNLATFLASGNQLTNLSIPVDMTSLSFVDLSDNQLLNVTLPPGLNHLNFLRLAGNRLTRLTLPAGLTNLASLFLQSNQLTNLVLGPDLVHLVQLDLQTNNLTTLTLPPDMAQLSTLLLGGNPLANLVLSELLASTSLSGTVVTLRNQGVSVFTYPLAIQIIRIRQPIGAFQFAVTGPPGVYSILASSNLVSWSVLTAVNNPFGSVVVTDGTAHLAPHRFYRALLQGSPTNMVFIPPNTFTMGSPTNDLDRGSNESPQTTVTLTRGFWMAKYEVTEGEYLEVTGTNPSEFPGDLSRAVSSVTWQDATNYCALLTQRELAAGRISAGSQYRLPTEAEWECAARAGTTTRFNYGDDPGYASLTNYAWFLDLAVLDLTVHSVGQKLPNPWGLYDMHGNVWEWCADNYGLLPGGVQVDPTGPASTLLRDKVMRGGAYDYPNSSCRSASRLFRFPLFPDSDVGFRVVLVTGP